MYLSHFIELVVYSEFSLKWLSCAMWYTNGRDHECEYRAISLRKYQYKPFPSRLPAMTGFHVDFTWQNTRHTMLKPVDITALLTMIISGTIKWE